MPGLNSRWLALEALRLREVQWSLELPALVALGMGVPTAVLNPLLGRAQRARTLQPACATQALPRSLKVHPLLIFLTPKRYPTTFWDEKMKTLHPHEKQKWKTLSTKNMIY